jgi:ABC-2 type transport system permease protein
MNSKLWVLTKVFLKNGGDSWGKENKKKISKALLTVFIVVTMLASIGIPFGLFIGEGYNILAPLGQEGVILGLLMAITSVTVFVFGIFYVLTVFYFSRDIEFLLPLPLNPYEILGAKFITVVIYEYLMESVLLAPALIVYGFKSGAGILYYIYSIIIFASLPVIPLVMASVITMIIMRFTSIGKHRDALKVIGGIVAIAFGLGINVFIQRSTSSMGSQEEIVKMLTAGENSAMGIFTAMFPSAKVAAFSLTEAAASKGLLNLLLFLLITIAFTAIFLLLSQVLYFKGVVGSSETYSKRKELTSQELDNEVAESSSIKSYTLKELKVLFRTPAYLMNCVIMNFLWPVFFIIPMLAQGHLGEILGEINKYANNKSIFGIILAVTFSISLFISTSNGITATAISREGQNIFINKYIPMRYRDQIIAKVFSGIILSSSGIILILILVEAAARFPLYMFLLMMIVSLLGVTFTAFTGIFIDLYTPKLNWDNEQKAVKQNLNVIINMLLGIILAVLSGYLFIAFKVNVWYIFSSITGVFGIINLILYNLVGTLGERMFEKIEG